MAHPASPGFPKPFWRNPKGEILPAFGNYNPPPNSPPNFPRNFP